PIFLNAFAHVASVMSLYSPGHPARERAVDDAYEALDALAAAVAAPTFTFLEEEVVFGREPLRELKAWEWGRRLAGAGIQRLEIERRISREEFDGFLEEIMARVAKGGGETAENRQMRNLGIRFGAVGLHGPTDTDTPPADALSSTTLDLALGDEADTLRWLQQQAMHQGTVPMIEAEAVVRSLSVAMHSDRQVVLPLLQLKAFDQYTTTHSLNVSVLAMGLAEAMGCGPRDVRAIGVAGLLHDVGKIRIPLEVLTKPGRLSDDELRLMRAHPADGARLLLQSPGALEVAAIVAYEHHIMLDGGGYPQAHFRRACAMASRLVHVCDVYDALRTNRPYREAWSSMRTVEYLQTRAGTEFDPDIVRAFVTMLETGQARVQVLEEERASVMP
ncbi:MAG: HD-GYP domain-containing protein, partial [Vicinamibacterales bacterium]